MPMTRLILLVAIFGFVFSCDSDAGQKCDEQGPIALPIKQQAGGPADAPPVCLHFFGSGRRTSQGCLSSVGACTDGLSYALYCEATACWCIRDAMVTAEVAIEDGCPGSVQELASLCGFSLA